MDTKKINSFQERVYLLYCFHNRVAGGGLCNLSYEPREAKGSKNPPPQVLFFLFIQNVVFTHAIEDSNDCMIEYRGFICHFAFDEKDQIFHGRVANNANYGLGRAKSRVKEGLVGFI